MANNSISLKLCKSNRAVLEIYSHFQWNHYKIDGSQPSHQDIMLYSGVQVGHVYQTLQLTFTLDVYYLLWANKAAKMSNHNSSHTAGYF